MNLVQSYRCLDQNRISNRVLVRGEDYGLLQNQLTWICSVHIPVIQAIICTSILSSLSIDRSSN